jgi:integrase
VRSRTIRAYTIRHTGITRSAKHMDFFVLHLLAGHTDMNTMKRYVHPDERHILEAISKVRGGHTSGRTGEKSDPNVVVDSSSI